jgi:hypothetical protein
MSINLNDSQFESTPIFNGGKAGLARDIEIVDVVTRKVDDNPRTPDYKILFKDERGAEINQGWYYFSPKEGASAEKIEKSKQIELSRLVHLARAVMGEDSTLPEVTDVQNALDVVMKLVKDNGKAKKYNVYVTYGSAYKPSQYLGLRYFNFIEDASNEVSKLRPSANDVLERVTPDEPTVGNATKT